MTENHSYDTPTEGAQDWHLPLNDNFEKLDRDVEIRDTEANLENYQPKNNAKFLATDTGNVFLGDGSDWNPLKSGGGVTVDAVTASGDGSKTVFTLPHSHGTKPSAVFVQARNEMASAGFWTNSGNHTDATVEIEYSAAPAQGDDNLEYVVLTVN